MVARLEQGLSAWEWNGITVPLPSSFTSDSFHSIYSIALSWLYNLVILYGDSLCHRCVLYSSFHSIHDSTPLALSVLLHMQILVSH